MGTIRFFEGNNATQDIVGTLDDSSEQHISFKIDRRFENDEARSMTLENVRPGTRIEVYDDSRARRNDDWAVIEVKQARPRIVVPTFQMNLDNPDFKITYYRRDNLDGKVSHIKVFPGALPVEPTVIESVYQKLAEEYGNWPAKNGIAYEYNSQGHNYRVYRPEISQRPDGGYDVSLKLNHIRGWAKDDYARIVMEFDARGILIKAESHVEIANDRILTNTISVVDDLPAELKSNKYVVIGTASLKLFDALYADMQAQAESGGRLFFPEAIKHNMNRIGGAVVDAI